MPRSPAASPALSTSSAPERPWTNPRPLTGWERRLTAALAAVRRRDIELELADRVFALALDGTRDVRVRRRLQHARSRVLQTIDGIAHDPHDDLWFAAGWIRHLLVTDVGLAAAEIRQLFDAIGLPADEGARSVAAAPRPTDPLAPGLETSPDDSIDPDDDDGFAVAA